MDSLWSITASFLGFLPAVASRYSITEFISFFVISLHSFIRIKYYHSCSLIPIKKHLTILKNWLTFSYIPFSCLNRFLILGQKISPDKHVRALSPTICFLFFSIPAVGTELARLNSGGLKHVIQTVESQGGKVQLFSDFLYHSLVLL